MSNRLLVVSLLAGAIAALPTALLAQQWPAPPPPAKNPDRLPSVSPQTPPPPQVDELTTKQIEHAPEPQAAPRPPVASEKKETEKKPKKTASKHPPRHTAHAHTVACRGVFAKSSSHAELENAFKPQHVAFAQVDGSDGSKVMASVLFPKDPKQRLEVWWQNEQTRSGTYLIVINGRSTWAAPDHLELGLGLAALERINRKPFKLKGLDKSEGIQVSDWNGGALAQLAGDCKVGMRLRPDSKASAKARAAASGDREFVSNNSAIRAIKPTVAEIIIGY